MRTFKIIIIFLAVLASCKNTSENQAHVEQAAHDHQITVSNAQFNEQQMKLGSLTEQKFDQTIAVNGKIDVPPQNKAQVSTFMGGYVTKTPLLIGDKVKKGQLLVTLENTAYVELQQEYAQLVEQLTYLKSEYERQETLYNEKISSKKNFLMAESAYKSALATTKGLEKKLDMLGLSPAAIRTGNTSSTINIYAPISGTISKVYVSNGKYVAPADVILEIIDTHHVHLELTVYEKDVLSLKKGQEITFKIPEASDDAYRASVYLVGNKIDEKGRSVQVHAHIENEKEHFLVGMFAEAEIIVNSEIAIALPNRAIVELDNEKYILVLEDKDNDGYHFEKTDVEVTHSNEDYSSIKDLARLNGRQILIEGAKTLIEPDLEGGHGH